MIKSVDWKNNIINFKGGKSTDYIARDKKKGLKEYVKNNKELIYNRLVEFLKNDDIQESLSKRTSDKDIVNLRLKMWFKEFEDAISL